MLLSDTPDSHHSFTPFSIRFFLLNMLNFQLRIHTLEFGELSDGPG